MRELAADYEGRAVVATINVDKHGSLVKDFGAQLLPTNLFFVNGQLQDKIVGFGPKALFAEKLDALLLQASAAE